MKIVEYNHSYAKKVARMWNKSNESWGNSDSVTTENDVIASESSSGNIKLYLAIENDEVIGYCSLSEYRGDEGASYLPTLNVIPEYHGKKVGKMLILKVLEDAIESEWPRFDLYTWSGNTKAMPLYKKCGFFWERKNDTVHLMNFIPYLFQTEALEEYLTKLDWYKDSKREINMEQDGVALNGFEYYRYDFENDKTRLAIEFEKTGRGIKYIDTPDYSIEMIVSDHNLVFDNEYEVFYKIVNKTNEDLSITLLGKDNKNIKCSINKTVLVENESIVKDKFYVGTIKKDQKKGKTHPVVETDIIVNGKKATFKIGIEPKYPVKISLRPVEYNHTLHRNYECYLDVENNLSTKESFNIQLPNSFVEFSSEVNVILDAKQKRSVKVNYSLNDYGFYNEQARISYGKKVVEKKLEGSFKGATKSYTYLMENQAGIVSGNYVFRYGLETNNAALVNDYKSTADTAHLVPSIGKPYSLEFSNTRPVIEFKSDNDMDVILKSKTFKDVSLVIHFNHTFGIVTINYELINKGQEKKLALSTCVWQFLKDSIIPFNGKLLELPGIEGADIQVIKQDLIDENWFYNTKTRYGFTWDKNEKMSFSVWKVVFNKEDIKLKKGESYKSSNFCFSLVHPTVEAFREFAGNKGERKHVGFIDININKGNPFAHKDVEVSIINNKKTTISGTYSIDDIETPLESTVSVVPGLKQIKLNLKDSNVFTKRLIHSIKGQTSCFERDDILEVDNGFLSFKASRKFADSIYSLKLNGEEWLDSNYPTPKERAWWADFIGGITQRCSGIQDNATLKEERRIEFIRLKDNFGNEWQGIKVSLIIKKDEGLEGLTFDTYCLTLPGVKLIHTFSNITNNSGKLLLNKEFYRSSSLKVDDKPEDVLCLKDGLEYKCNNIGIETIVDKLAVFKGNRLHLLGIYNPVNKLLVNTQKEYLNFVSIGSLTIPDQTSQQFRGDFIMFSEEVLNKEMLQDLDNIRFIL